MKGLWREAKKGSAAMSNAVLNREGSIVQS